MRLLLIAGMSCAGKSTLSRWLKEHHGFCHIHTDDIPSPIDSLRLRAAWDRCWSGNAADFIAALRGLGQPVAFDWAFPDGCLPIVRALKAAGMEIWWLDADEAQGRIAHNNRGRGDIADYDALAAGVRANRDEIMRVFGANVIVTLDAAGRRLEPQEIWQRMTADCKSAAAGGGHQPAQT